MKHRILSAVLAAAMTLSAAPAVHAAAESSLTAETAQVQLAKATVNVPYSCPFVYETLIFYRYTSYPEGMGWTNDDFYEWNGGGTYYGGYGCVAFAYLMSDKAFAYLQSREYFTLDPASIRVGDILRQSGHSFIVLEVQADGVIIAEGNYNDSIHWGRKITFDELADGFEYHITRYPESGFAFACDTMECSSNQTYLSPLISRDDPNVTWTSSDTSIATVDAEGNVSTLRAGTVTITAASGDSSDSYKLVVDGGVEEPSEPVTTYPTWGNLNGDEAVDATDAAAILMASAAVGAGSESGLTAAQASYADVDNSGTFDATDAALVLQYAAYTGTGGTQALREFLGIEG